ncbi:hypothetical protein LSM04_001526 [Trypanosoma melophagium]|uniref:uncharacterized protein n=1 Tax=Trypanosoma melophagium TaxID=715481 RepID=UPI00351A44F9|nr:hypothetical protein LSM04_000801 [Trypanosoma melophagium]KAH9579784.1 hypothetical protein LSM04_001526 [Trypanosoma melophagium]
MPEICPPVSNGTGDPKTVVFTYRNVERKLDSVLHRSVVDTIEQWDFFPYPSCTRRQLEEVDLYVVAHRNIADVGTAADNANETAAAMETAVEVKATAGEIAGVVGVVWVPLTPGEQLEGYIQVVLVEPQSRKCRIARSLLERTLRMREVGEDRRRHILRWRLHTMSPSQNTTQYLRSVLHCRATVADTAAVEKGHQDEEEQQQEMNKVGGCWRLFRVCMRVWGSL